MDPSFKPYLIRAMYEWCVDYGHEPYLAVAVDDSCKVPMPYVTQGQIVLDLSPESIKDLDLGLEWVSFKARFSGVVHSIDVPMHRIIGLFPTHDQGLGAFFEPTDHPVSEDTSDNIAKDSQKPAEKVVSVAKSKIFRVK